MGIDCDLDSMTKSEAQMQTACIFDLDGVLADSAPCHYQAWKVIADELGVTFDEERNHLLRGVSRRQSLEIMIEGQRELSEENLQECMTRKNELFQDLVDQAGASLLLPGVINLLAGLRKADIKLAVASASKNAKTILGNTGLLDGYFDAIVDGTHTTRSKPDPQVFLLAAEQLEIQPEYCLVFEDAPAGVDAAIAAGMRSVGIGTAELGHATYMAASLDELSVEDVLTFFRYGILKHNSQ